MSDKKNDKATDPSKAGCNHAYPVDGQTSDLGAGKDEVVIVRRCIPSSGEQGQMKQESPLGRCDLHTQQIQLDPETREQLESLAGNFATLPGSWLRK